MQYEHFIFERLAVRRWKNAMLRVKQRRKRRGSGYRIYSTATIKTGDRLVNAVPRFIAATSKKKQSRGETRASNAAEQVTPIIPLLIGPI